MCDFSSIEFSFIYIYQKEPQTSYNEIYNLQSLLAALQKLFILRHFDWEFALLSQALRYPSYQNIIEIS